MEFPQSGCFENRCDIIRPSEEDVPELPKYLISDVKLVDSLCESYYVQSFHVVQSKIDGKIRPLFLITWQYTPRTIQVSDAARKAVLLSLREEFHNVFNYGFMESTRWATFAIEGYEAIAVKDLPDLIARPFNVHSAWMISPFTEEDDEKRGKAGWSKERFTAEVVNAQPFSLVVDWVEQHSLRKTPPTRQEIIETYQRLISEYYDAAVEEDTKAKENQ